MNYLNQYEYNDNPYYKTNSFAIRPLSEQGFRTYVSKDSQVHKFLNQTGTEKYFRDEENQNNNETIRNKKRVDIETDKKVQKSGIVFKETNSNSDIREDKLIKNNSHMLYIDKDSNLKMGSLQKYSQCQNNRGKFYAVKQNKKPINLFTYKIKSGTGDQESYENQIQEMKIKLSNNTHDIIRVNNHNHFKSFQSYNIPRVDKIESRNINPSKQKLLNYSERISRTVAGLRNRKSENIEVAEEIKKENKRLNSILMNQTNSNFLQRFQLPDISSIRSHTRITVRKIGIGNTKDLGEKYNPYSLLKINKNWNGRNYHGSLYQH